MEWNLYNRGLRQNDDKIILSLYQFLLFDVRLRSFIQPSNPRQRQLSFLMQRACKVNVRVDERDNALEKHSSCSHILEPSPTGPVRATCVYLV